MAAQVEAGTNPIEVKRLEREKATTRTFQALADRYLKEHAERHKRPRSAEEDRRNLKVHVLPKWGRRDFRTIRRADVIELIEYKFLFPSRLSRGGPIDRHSLATAMTRFGESLKGATAKTWQQDPPSSHDLRRTANTRLAKMGVSKEVRDRVLNHITSRRDPEGKNYNLYEYRTEKASALNRWADEIVTMIKPAAVVPMRTRGLRR